MGFDERACIARLEAAGPAELAVMLQSPSPDEEDALRVYLGDARFERMHEMAVLQSAGVRGRRPAEGNVVVIHGIMGGELTATRSGRRRHVWARVLRLATGGIAELRLDERGRSEADPAITVEATGIMKKHYGELILRLGGAWNVRAFWYDWRRDLAVAAASLEARATAWFGRDAPFHIVAHSMGGLVARTFARLYADRWARMAETSDGLRTGGRLLMLGTPNHGSFAIPQIITGLEGMVRKLALVDLRHSRQDIVDIVTTFLGSYQMMPSPLRMPHLRALYDPRTWAPARVPKEMLDAALAQHDLLAEVGDASRMGYIAGCNQPTLVDLAPPTAVRDAGAYRASFDGDGRVPHALGLLDGVPTWWVEADHGDLARDGRVLAVVDELLRTGDTAALPRTKPATRGTDAQAAKLLEEAMAEDERELAAYIRRTRLTRAQGAEPDYVSADERIAEDLLTRGWLSGPDRGEAVAGAPTPRAEAVTIEVRLVQGSIADAGEGLAIDAALPVDAVAVGHYRDVRPTAAELAIDRAISAAIADIPPAQLRAGDLLLTQLTERGTIPGGLGQPFLLRDPRASAREADRVIAIAGMGTPGTFGAPELTVLVRELAWSLGRMGLRHLATVLIGAGNGNLPVAQAVRTWLQGLALGLAGEAPVRRLRRVTFVEFDHARVLEIDEALAAAVEPKDRSGFTYVRLDASARNAHASHAREQAIGRAQQQVQDLMGKSGADVVEAGNRMSRGERLPTRVTFTREGNTFRMGAITADAAIPEREVTLDHRLVTRANDELAGERFTGMQLDRGRFLRQLLVPAELRPRLATDAPLVLMLDATTARIHWEMVAQPSAGPDVAGSAAAQPLEDLFLGTARGLTRQLRTTFAPPPEPPPPPRRVLRVLVVADPAADAHLPGAAEEGMHVARLFESFNTVHAGAGLGSVKVERLIGPRAATRTNVLRRIMNEPFDVLHFAGHCAYDAKEPARSGWIFSDGEVLSAFELNRIDRIPKFVFSNACESGITPDRSEKRSVGLAPSFAEAFFARGVANFVCTAWPVDDLAARVFALELYARLIGIEPLRTDAADADAADAGDGAAGRTPLQGGPQPMYRAMQAARQRIMRTPNGVRTWGAYQHYGNPFFRLFSDEPDAADNVGAAVASKTRGKASRKKTAKKTATAKRR